MAAAKRKAGKAPAKAASAAPGGPEATLKEIPITHHAVSAHLARAEAALALFQLAEEHYEDADDALEFARGICLEVIGDELARAKGAYAEAVSDKLAPAAEIAR